MEDIKKSLYDQAQKVINERIAQTKHSIEEAMESVMDNEKSSVGDKFETGREMASQEVDKHRNSYENLLKMQSVLYRINPLNQSDSVENGALVITDKDKFSISVGLGRLDMDGETFLLISRNAPLMTAFSGKHVGDKVSFNNNSFHVKEIY